MGMPDGWCFCKGREAHAWGNYPECHDPMTDTEWAAQTLRMFTARPPLPWWRRLLRYFSTPN